MLFAQPYSYKKGVQALGESAREGVYNEADDLYQRDAFEPIHIYDVNWAEEWLAYNGNQQEGSSQGRIHLVKLCLKKYLIITIYGKEGRRPKILKSGQVKKWKKKCSWMPHNCWN